MVCFFDRIAQLFIFVHSSLTFLVGFHFYCGRIETKINPPSAQKMGARTWRYIRQSELQANLGVIGKGP